MSKTVRRWTPRGEYVDGEPPKESPERRRFIDAMVSRVDFWSKAEAAVRSKPAPADKAGRRDERFKIPVEG